MWSHYLIVVWRNLLKYKFYALINIIGLALGITACIIIALFVLDELSYDRYHNKANRIYRVLWKTSWNEGQLYTPNILAPTLRREAPEVETAVRLAPPFSPKIVSTDGTSPGDANDKRFMESRFYLADSTIFDVLSLPFLEGNPQNALTRRFTVVLTESMAKKYFGRESPLGKTLVVNNLRRYEVTGVIRDMPKNSHIHADFFASFTSNTAYYGDSIPKSVEFWGDSNFYTYILLREGASIASLEQRSPDIMRRQNNEFARKTTFVFEPLSKIHLHSKRQIEGEYKGDILYVYIFSCMAVLILAIACFNYMNLATARSVRRSREVGVRKSIGASTGNLIVQFYLESAIITTIAFIIALVAVEILLPRTSALLGKQLLFESVLNPIVLGVILTAWLLTVIFAGSYPALFLSSIRPADVLANSRKAHGGAAFIRRVLVVLQFSISVFLLVATFVVRGQLQYINNHSIGYDKEHILLLPIADRTTFRTLDVLIAELKRVVGVKDVGVASEAPGDVQGGYSYTIPEKPGENFVVTAISTDESFTRLLNIGLIAGKPLPKRYEQDSLWSYFVLNEAGVQKLGWKPEEALQKELNLNGRKGRIVGVMKNFHSGPLHEQIEPLLIFSQPNKDVSLLLVKTDGTHLGGTMNALKTTWNRIVPHRPFEVQFLDEEIAASYRAEQRMGTLFTISTIMALIVAGLGLLGLVAFAAEARAKEIGVRKVLGASSQSIILLLAKDFLRLIMIAFLIAAPISWYAAQRWLQGFAYRMDLHWWIFVIAGCITALFAFVTVAVQSYQAASVNPVDTLRSE